MEPRLRRHSAGAEPATAISAQTSRTRGAFKPPVVSQRQRQQRKHSPKSINPIWLSQQFQNYRKKQAEKDDKADQKWPDVLEDAFLDALLLIPQMGRKKYAMRGAQHGRNMLISQYLWISYCQSLPPGAKPDAKMWRERKQVSSHIQVLKNFFIHHRCYHFFFPGREKKEDKSRDSSEADAFRDNPVLLALAEGRLPEERPNYDYFAQLLASDALVTVRPKRCWLFVSNRELELRREGGGCKARHPAAPADVLKRDAFPHLAVNLNRERWDDALRAEHGVLLHEYTRALAQHESSSVRDLAREWQLAFPELWAPLDVAAQNHACDILHLHATLQLPKVSSLPQASDLKCWVEIAVAQPALLGHRWKVVTRLARPEELWREPASSSTSAAARKRSTLYSDVQEVEARFEHRPGCAFDGSAADSGCGCLSQRRQPQPTMTVPFPAEPWARMLTNCAGYPAHPHFAKQKKKKSSASSSRSRARVVKEEEEDSDLDIKDNKDDVLIGSVPQPGLTQMDLMQRVAMMQELWSCPKDGNGEWTRRSVLLWTFETVHRVADNGKLVTAGAGHTNWRFLTAVDPASQYHLQQALLSQPVSYSSPKLTAPSPTPSFHLPFGTATSDGLPPPFESTPGFGFDTSSPLQRQTSVFDSFATTPIATPPPTTAQSPAYCNAIFQPDHSLESNALGYYDASAGFGMDEGVLVDPFLIVDDVTSGPCGWDEVGALQHQQQQQQQQCWPAAANFDASEANGLPLFSAHDGAMGITEDYESGSSGDSGDSGQGLHPWASGVVPTTTLATSDWVLPASDMLPPPSSSSQNRQLKRSRSNSLEMLAEARDSYPFTSGWTGGQHGPLLGWHS